MSDAPSPYSWTERVPYLCVCGTTYPVARQRWVDRDAEPERHAQILIDGPLRGRCPLCGEHALGRTSWLEIVPSESRATLVLGAHERAELVEHLKRHLDHVTERAEATPGWLLQPQWRFEAGRSTSDGSAALSLEDAEELEDIVERRVARRPRSVAQRLAAAALEEEEAGIPKPVGQGVSAGTTAPSKDAHVALLTVVGGMPTIEIQLDEEARSLWGRAALRVRPIHLREYGYPLIGVRVFASYLGSSAVLDAVVDVATEEANEVFAHVSNDFIVRLSMISTNGGTPVSREVSAQDLGRNAALCLESARGTLAAEEFPPDAFERAYAELSGRSFAERVDPAPHPLAPGDFMHLLTPRESWMALEALDQSSDKGNLARLLEVDGLPVSEFEAIRKRVLAGATSHGICAPRRFWRRIIASGLVADAAEYARTLAAARHGWEEEDDDLSEDLQQRAWERIHELCSRRDVAFPAELIDALGLEAPGPRPRAGNGTQSAAGEIQIKTAVPRTKPPSKSSGRASLLDPRVELAKAVPGLGDKGAEVGASEVMGAFDAMPAGELLDLLPTIREMGSQAIPDMVSRLESQRAELRQAAAILLSLAPDGAAVRPLVTRLFAEPTKIWIDVARALGAMGPRALGPLTATLRDRPAPKPGDEAVLRAAWAMAEVALGDGGSGLAQDAVEALAEAPQPAVSRAASRALATLSEVKLVNEQVRGRREMPEVTHVRGYARRVYEALGLGGGNSPRREQTQVIDVGDLMELQAGSADEVTEIDPGEIESLESP